MLDYDEVNSPAPILEENHEYLSSRNAQIFMSRFNIHLPGHILKTLNLYLVLFVKDLLKDDCLSCPPSKFQLEAIIESKMESNLTFHALLRDVSTLEASSTNNLNFNHKPQATKKFESQTKIFFSPFLNQLPSFLKSSTNSFQTKSNKYDNNWSKDQLFDPIEPYSSKEPLTNVNEYSKVENTTNEEVLPRSQLVIVAPWQIMYHCPMSASFSSPSLLAHIEMAGAVLNSSAAKFMGTFISQLSLAMLRELVRLTQLSQRAVLTTDILQEAFRPTISYQPLKFPIFYKMHLKGKTDLDEVSKGIEFEEQLNIALFSPVYISQAAISSSLSYHNCNIELSYQSFLLLNRFLDEVVISLANKLNSDKFTLIQIQAALNLTLKACPMLNQAFQTIEKTFNSFLAVPIQPFTNRQSQNQEKKRNSLASSHLQQHYRLVAQYFSPQSNFYQSQFIAEFFHTQEHTLDTKLSQYLAAVIGQLGLELILLARGLLERQHLKYNVISTHVLISALKHALPFCEVASRLNIYSFNHTDPAPANSNPGIPIFTSDTTPSLSTSDSSSTYNSSVATDNTILLKSVKMWNVPRSLIKRSISLPKHTSTEQSQFENDSATVLGSVYTRPSIDLVNVPRLSPSVNQQIDLSKCQVKSIDFDALLQSDITLRLTLTPTNLPR